MYRLVPESFRLIIPLGRVHLKTAGFLNCQDLADHVADDFDVRISGEKENGRPLILLRVSAVLVFMSNRE